MNNIIITLDCGEVWELPAKVIQNSMLEYSEDYRDRIDDRDEVIDWLQNNMNFSEFENELIKVKERDVDHTLEEEIMRVLYNDEGEIE